LALLSLVKTHANRKELPHATETAESSPAFAQ